MPLATVLIPTHSHAEPLRHAVASVQAQTIQDFELFIVGDGVTDATRAVAAELAVQDPRIRFFDYPKGPRKGEVHRHEALKQASGRIVAYVGDDDIWFAEHLQTLDRLLADADFGHTMHIGVDERGELFMFAADLESPWLRAQMLATLHNRFDLTFGGHTLDAYRRLPGGWHTTPVDFRWSDLFLWRQFLAEPWCRARSAMVPTGICTHTHLRPHLSGQERAQELGRWRSEAAKPEFREFLWRKAAASFARDLVRCETQLAAVRGSLSRRATAPPRVP